MREDQLIIVNENDQIIGTARNLRRLSDRPREVAELVASLAEDQPPPLEPKRKEEFLENLIFPPFVL